jgi:hypothetical protein
MFGCFALFFFLSLATYLNAHCWIMLYLSNHNPLWKNRVFCYWACKWILKLQWPLATLCISTMWVLLNQLQKLQQTQLILYMKPYTYAIHATIVPLCCNYGATTQAMMCWCGFYPSIQDEICLCLLQLLCNERLQKIIKILQLHGNLLTTHIFTFQYYCVVMVPHWYTCLQLGVYYWVQYNYNKVVLNC